MNDGELYSSVYRAMLSLTHSPDDAHDATNEAFMRLYRLDRDKIECLNVKAWLIRAARNYQIDLWRKGRKFAPEINQDAMIDTGPSPEEIAERNETSDELVEIINTFRPNVRIAVYHRFVLDLAHAETARIVGAKTEHAISKRCFDAIHKLRIALKEMDHESCRRVS